jgi:hypothetical protein
LTSCAAQLYSFFSMALSAAARTLSRLPISGTMRWASSSGATGDRFAASLSYQPTAW